MAEGDQNTEVRSLIDVDILGHIFEQSITDLERLRLSLGTSGRASTRALPTAKTPKVSNSVSHTGKIHHCRTR